jgi:hypothetical protein
VCTLDVHGPKGSTVNRSSSKQVREGRRGISKEAVAKIVLELGGYLGGRRVGLKRCAVDEQMRQRRRLLAIRSQGKKERGYAPE